MKKKKKLPEMKTMVCKTCKRPFTYNAVEKNRQYCGHECAHVPFTKASRIEEILAMRAKGMTLQAIGKHYQITRERVRQIIKERQTPCS